MTEYRAPALTDIASHRERLLELLTYCLSAVSQEQLRALWGWRIKANREYSLKGFHKPTVPVDGEATAFHLVP